MTRPEHSFFGNPTGLLGRSDEKLRSQRSRISAARDLRLFSGRGVRCEGAGQTNLNRCGLISIEQVDRRHEPV
jgi:hypothetical protein